MEACLVLQGWYRLNQIRQLIVRHLHKLIQDFKQQEVFLIQIKLQIKAVFSEIKLKVPRVKNYSNQAYLICRNKTRVFKVLGMVSSLKPI